MKVFLTGATGLIGSHALRALSSSGHSVRALARDPDKLARVFDHDPGILDGVEVVSGDLRDHAALEASMRGCEGLLHCAGLFSHDLADAALLEETNVEGTRVALEAGIRAGLERMVLVSSMLALFPPAGARMSADDPVRTPRAMYSATKARAEGVARQLQAAGRPIHIVYPGSVHGPFDPTVGSGPGIHADALRSGRILVTEGGLAHTDVRDLARILALLFDETAPPARSMAPSFFLTHAQLYRLLVELTGRPLRAMRLPGGLLRLLGWLSDRWQAVTGRGGALTHEAAQVLTRSVPLDDAWARARLGRLPIEPETSFRDLLVWMAESGHLSSAEVGRLASEAPDAERDELE